MTASRVNVEHRCKASQRAPIFTGRFHPQNAAAWPAEGSFVRWSVGLRHEGKYRLIVLHRKVS